MEILLILGLLVAGLVLIALVGIFRIEIGEASKVSLLLAPLIAFLLLSGAITELEGLGWKAKFSAIAQNRIVSAAEAADLLIVDEAASNPNFLKDMFTRPCRPYYVVQEGILPPELSDDDKRLVQHIALQIRRSMLCGAFVALVVVDDRFQPIGLLEASSLQEILRIKLTARNFKHVASTGLVVTSDPFSEIIASELGLALTNPRFQAKGGLASRVFVNIDASVEETYSELLVANANVAAIIDRHGRFEGIVTRRVIEGWIIGQLITTNQT
ncbi:MAG: hypothetical protein WDZ83_14045 [Rhizobiaceae bacterium]